jgi:hypothetical protein
VVNEPLDVIILEPGPHLDRSVFSIAMQDHAPVVLHLPEPSDLVRAVLSLNPAVTLRTHGPPTGRYLAWLRSGDVVHPGAYRTLIADLHETGAALALGAIATKRVACSPHACTTLDRLLLPEGDALDPIHRFVLDRSKVADADLRFHPGLFRHLCAKYPVSRRQAATVIGDRYVPSAISMEAPRSI